MNIQEVSLVNIKALSSSFSIPLIDVLSIAINRYGIRADITDKRIRFKIHLLDYNKAYYMAVCVNTFDSPFYLDDKKRLLLNNEVLGNIFDIEKDTCDTTYFRRNKTELTLNSNMRSRCQGCTFCGTYNLDPDDRIDMSDENKIAAFLTTFLQDNHMDSLKDLVRVTICTGCFSNESELVGHILTVSKVFKDFGFNKRIRYIGSQIRTEEAMDLIKSKLPYFSLSLTVECFSNREQRMRKEKASLDMTEILKVLKRAKEHDFSTNYLYIVGLDELNVLKTGISKLTPYINRMPIFQVMQNYIGEHEVQRVEEAKGLEYYLKARKIIEEQFSNTELHPRSWENYRGLFYTMYQDKSLDCIRI